LLAAFWAAGQAGAEVGFNRDIRPIMSDTCFRCHGPDAAARMAGLRLDIREEALKPTASGAIPIVPGDPEKSAIVERIFSKSPARIMPPKYAHKELTGQRKETIRRWVAEGAKYEGHWAYLPIRRPDVPKLADPKAPVRNPIDAFVQARLEREGLKPSPEAGRRTLIRRVSLDLTGIPPSLQEVEAFVNDRSPDAYQRLVDRLLASPRYAEKQAMHWLDAVRYGDTAGFHGDNPYPIWPYRDYVLRALRDNKPFDVFTREQLAGDLLPGATTEQLVASAYNRLNRMSAEGGVQPKEYLAKYASDRVRTTSAVWLGATLGCAECHDHKFDPILSKDFYSMKAFFADILETGLVPDRGSKAWGAQISLPSPEQQRQRERLSWQLAEARRNLQAEAEILAAQDEGWDKRVLARYEAGELMWRRQRPLTARSANGAKLDVYNDELLETSYYVGASLVSDKLPGDGLVIASGPNPDNETYIVTFRPGEGVWTALGVEVVQDESLPSFRLARGADRLLVSEVEAEISSGGGPARKLPFVLAASSTSSPSAEHPPMAAIDGNPRTGWGIADPGHNGDVLLALRFDGKVRTDADSVITVRVRHDSEYRRATIGRFRIALSGAEHSWPSTESRRATEKSGEPAPAGNRGLSPELVRALRATGKERSEAHRNALLDYYQWASPDLQPLLIQVARLEAELGLLEAGIPRVVVTKSTRPQVTRVLPRANWMDDSGEIVEPAIPAFLGNLDTNGRRATRLALAGWLTSPDNPLTARVFVNRQWRQFFGTGISGVLDDLGSQGEWPTHPELLDWLAAEFMEPSWRAAGAHPWDVKHMIRTIVTSHTYRQSSLADDRLMERDPDNRLLARQSRFRVDAEIVRDIALAVSGLLVEKFGGPSVRPYQPDGYLAALNFPMREYSASRGPDLYRRGVYTFWQRTFLHPSLLTFDASTREECTVNRPNSNTPLQALVLLNDPIFVEAARAFAQNIVKDGGRDLKSRIGWAFYRATGRHPTPEEHRTLAGLYGKNLARFRAAPEEARKLATAGEAPLLEGTDPVEVAAMTTVARAILNLHETITRN
jgi:hypothetical protein